ncbi:MAG: SpoIVB peptidase [Bacilli bacterium]|nr:SpoIVB peptidase [Bacilli bacterium]
MKTKRMLLTFFLSIIIPFCEVFAYSNRLYVGGENIGIEVKTKGVLVIGLYKVNNTLINESSGITKGDYITKINDIEIKNIEEFSREINKNKNNDEVLVEYRRGNSINKTNIKLYKDNDEIKTGLYVKDSVSGIGTLTAIDPSNNKFFALGHAVLDSSTNNVLQIDDGSIYSSYITGINKSSDGNPGEKYGESNIENKYGIITGNTNKGIFGSYDKSYDSNRILDIKESDEIKLGKASIYTVIDKDEIKEYSINIDSISYNDKLKNILFTITDKELLEKTGGIIQGMSGSPIVQDNKIIGAVTHVVVNDPTRGYGIFITTMLKEAE